MGFEVHHEVRNAAWGVKHIKGGHGPTWCACILTLQATKSIWCQVVGGAGTFCGQLGNWWGYSCWHRRSIGGTIEVFGAVVVGVFCLPNTTSSGIWEG